MTESLAAVAFYLGVGALLLGGIRLARAQLERQPTDRFGIAALAFALGSLTFAVILFAHGPRGVLPF